MGHWICLLADCMYVMPPLNSTVAWAATLLDILALGWNTQLLPTSCPLSSRTSLMVKLLKSDGQTFGLSKKKSGQCGDTQT